MGDEWGCNRVRTKKEEVERGRRERQRRGKRNRREMIKTVEWEEMNIGAILFVRRKKSEKNREAKEKEEELMGDDQHWRDRMARDEYRCNMVREKPTKKKK